MAVAPGPGNPAPFYGGLVMLGLFVLCVGSAALYIAFGD